MLVKKRHSLLFLSSFVFFLLSFLHKIKKKTKKNTRTHTHKKKNQKNLLLFSKSSFVSLSLFFRSTSGVRAMYSPPPAAYRGASFPPPPSEEEEEEEETRDALVFSICPNCKHATTRTTRRRRERCRDDDDDEGAETKSASPLTLCEMCQYIFISKGFEENLDPDVPMSLVSPSAPREEEHQRDDEEGHQRVETRKIRGKAHPLLFFPCGNCNSLLTLPELVARDCVLKESKLVVCGACEELTIMRVSEGGFRGTTRVAPPELMPPAVMMPPVMMMPPAMMFGGVGGAYHNSFSGLRFNGGIPAPRPRQHDGAEQHSGYPKIE